MKVVRDQVDKNLVKQLFTDIKVEGIEVKKIERIGTPSPDKSRPIKVTLAKKIDKKQFLVN